jgi:hypothetical protein
MLFVVVACSPPGHHATISKAVAIGAALKSTLDLEKASAEPHVWSYEATNAYMTTSAGHVTDLAGDTLNLSSPPSSAWVVELSAAPDGFWGSITAIAVVDSTAGFVSGGGLWKVPANGPTKPVG